MNEDRRNQQEGTPVEDPLNELTFAQIPIEFTELIREHAFLGKFSPVPLFEGIIEQFRDYINMEDKTNYVDIFYEQLHNSRVELLQDDWEEHQAEIKEVLSTIHRTFIDLMQKWFYQRLTIAITDLESESYDDEDLEFIIRRLYEFFILDARNNFKVVVSTIVAGSIKNWEDYSDEEYFPMVQKLVGEHSPLITAVTPMEFIKIRGDGEIFDLFENGRVTGNFLRKYSPKLYQNEEFMADIINYITSMVSPQATAAAVVIGDVLHKKLNRGDCVLWIDPSNYSQGFQVGVVNRLFLNSEEVEIVSPKGFLEDVGLYSFAVSRAITIKIDNADACKIVGERFSPSKIASFQVLQLMIEQNPGLTGEQIQEKFWKEGMSNGGTEDSNDDSNSEFLQ